MNMKKIMTLACMALVLFTAGTSMAATLTWNNGSGDRLWNTTSTNWGGATLWNNSTPDSATFTAVGAGTITVDAGGVTQAGVTINAGNYTFTGGSIGGTGPISISGGGNMSVASLGDAVGAGQITLNNSSFGWTGSATTLTNRQFVLVGNSSVTGSGGGLTVNTDLAISGAGAKSLTLLGIGGGINVWAGNITNGLGAVVSLFPGRGNTSWALSGTNTFSGGFFNGDGTYGGRTYYGTIIFRGAQSVGSGPLSVGSYEGSGFFKLLDDTAGTITLTNTLKVGTHPAGVFVGNNNTANGGGSSGTTTGSTIVLGTLEILSGYDSGTSFTLTGANNYRLQVGNVSLPLTSSGPALLNPTTAPLTIAGTVQQLNGATTALTLQLGGTATNNFVTGTIKDAADYPVNPNAKALSVTKSGTSTWTLSGTNTYSGTTTISAGMLKANGTNALGAGNVTVSAGTLQIDAANAIADTAELRLPSATGKNITMNANDTVGALYLAGAQQPNGAYTSSGAGSAWMNTGSGTLTVGSAVMYWDISGTTAGAGGATPSGTWNASNATWNDPTGTNTAASWTAGLTAAFAAGSDATGTYTVTVESTQDIGGLTFEDGNVTLTNGTALRMIANNSVYVAANRTATIATPFTQDVSGRALTKGGTGTLVLSADNTYSGVTTLSAGTLQLSHANAIGSAQVLNVTGSATVLLDTTVSLTTLWFASGVSTVSGGTLNFAPGGTITAMDNTVNQTIQSAITGSPAVRVNNGPNGGSYEGFIFAPNSGTQTLGVMSVPFNLGGGRDKAGVHLDGTTTGNSVSAVTFTAVNDSHYGTLYKDGSGTWTVGNVDIGAIRINGGTLVANGYLRYYYAGVFVNSGGALHYNNPGAVYSGFTLNGGSLDNSSGAAITNSTYNPVQAWNGDWTFIGSQGTNSDLYIGTGAVTLSATRQVTVSNAVTTLTVGGVISGATFGLVKAGAGTLKLTGKNTYSGATTISNGTLQVVVGGSCSNSAVTVAASTGTLAISVTNTVPKWTCSNLTLNSGNLKFSFSVAPSFTDAPLSITNTVAFSGSPIIVVDPANLQRAKKYPLLTVGGTPPVNVPAVSITGMSGILAWEGNTLYLTIPPAGTVILFR